MAAGDHLIGTEFMVKIGREDFQWPWFEMSGDHWDNENRYEAPERSRIRAHLELGRSFWAVSASIPLPSIRKWATAGLGQRRVVRAALLPACGGLAEAAPAAVAGRGRAGHPL